jgi:hypothetical protein
MSLGRRQILSLGDASMARDAGASLSNDKGNQ